ncbi:MAG TPA: aconitate hydratase, partial [Planctomycetes bacterium]|nr:aconitate hydratase [Planctomycetota bacterium]
MANIESSPEFVSATYAQMRSNLSAVRATNDRALPLAEKIVFGHIDDVPTQQLERGKAYLNLRPDRVALQDATAQMALLQFMMAGKNEAA